MTCRFYGHHAAMGMLIPTGGNQCALITGAYSPCRMEAHGQAPELEHCELNGSAAAAALEHHAAAGFKPSESHFYISTACHHSQHEQCRKTCKFCESPCRCVCHQTIP